jgi:hypothetical protein
MPSSARKSGGLQIWAVSLAGGLIYRKAGLGAPAIPMPGPRPRHPPPPIPLPSPPPIPLPPVPRIAGRSPGASGVVEGPLLAGITVTVLPGRSSRSSIASGAAWAGSVTGRGTASVGAAVADRTAVMTLGAWGLWRRAGAERVTRAAGRLVWCKGRSRPSSTGEANATSWAGAASVRSRCRAARDSCPFVSGEQPTTATKAVSGTSSMVRMGFLVADG